MQMRKCLPGSAYGEGERSLGGLKVAGNDGNGAAQSMHKIVRFNGNPLVQWWRSLLETFIHADPDTHRLAG